jgi:hypothetical protein
VWERFRAEHRDWWKAFGGVDPVYHLPEPVVRCLAAPRSAHRRLDPCLDAGEAAAEHAFRAACESAGREVVGVWNDRPVRYRLLDPRPPTITAQEAGRLGWATPASAERDGEVVSEQVVASDLQRLGYAGDRLLDPVYQAEVAELKARWERMGRPGVFAIEANLHDRPPAPTLPDEPNRRHLPEDQVRWLTDAGRFLRKHQLLRLVTWELPVPRGRLAGLPCEIVRLTAGPDAPVLDVPAQDDVPSGLDLRELVRGTQSCHAESLGLGSGFPVTNTSPRNGRPSTPAAVFRAWFVEWTVRSRYPGRKGLVARLVDALAELLGDGENPLSADRVADLRREYRHLRAGTPRRRATNAFIPRTPCHERAPTPAGPRTGR